MGFDEAELRAIANLNRVLRLGKLNARPSLAIKIRWRGLSISRFRRDRKQRAVGCEGGAQGRNLIAACSRPEMRTRRSGTCFEAGAQRSKCHTVRASAMLERSGRNNPVDEDGTISVQLGQRFRQSQPHRGYIGASPWAPARQADGPPASARAGRCISTPRRGGEAGRGNANRSSAVSRFFRTLTWRAPGSRSATLA